MSYNNPNGPRNNIGTTGTSGTSGLGTTGGSLGSSSAGLGTTGGVSRTIPLSDTSSTGTETSAEGLRGKAEQIASTVREKASELGSQVSERANAAVTSMGGTISQVANQLRGGNIPSSVAPYADRAAESLDRAGQYLQQRELSDFVDDVSGMIRRNPIPSVLTGIALGFLLARSSRR
jgi:hypothetical protein